MLEKLLLDTLRPFKDSGNPYTIRMVPSIGERCGGQRRWKRWCQGIKFWDHYCLNGIQDNTELPCSG